MARPKKIGLDYFPVDVVFDEKIQAIESLFGNDGIAWIIKFWQKAYKSEYGEVDLNGLFGDISANNSRITPEKQKEIIEASIKIGLIYQISQGIYTSNGIQKRISAVSKERENALKRRKNELFGEKPPNNPQTTTQSKVKESKEKKSIVFVKPTLAEVEEYIKEKQYDVDPVKFYAHYESNGWKVGRNKMASWKAAIVTWVKNNG